MDSSSWSASRYKSSSSGFLFKIDEKAHSKLVNEFDEAASPRDSRRLLRCAQPHASGLVTAVPSKEDGNEAIMSPQHFRTGRCCTVSTSHSSLMKSLSSFVHAAHLP